ncbi:hypothetical protein SAMN04487764_1523 [Gillisia sp. Hel1_33_143]|nr:hypothetical protein SAMN04487764_1523 [Gillisia sp. Hel1_33_143]
MSWSKIQTEWYKLPLKWWFHKLCCEWGWLVRNKDNWATYYHHLKLCEKQGYNLYGEKI